MLLTFASSLFVIGLASDYDFDSFDWDWRPAPSPSVPFGFQAFHPDAKNVTWDAFEVDLTPSPSPAPIQEVDVRYWSERRSRLPYFIVPSPRPDMDRTDNLGPIHFFNLEK